MIRAIINTITDVIKFIFNMILNLFNFILALLGLIGTLALGTFIPVLVLILLGYLIFTLLF